MATTGGLHFECIIVKSIVTQSANKHVVCFYCILCTFKTNNKFSTYPELTQRDLLKFRPDKPQVLNAYGTLKLQCFLLLGSVDPYSVKWQRNDVDLDYKHDPRMLHNFTFMKRSADIFDSQAHSETTVTIQNLTVNDSGHYSCKVPGDSLNKTVDVVVNGECLFSEISSLCARYYNMYIYFAFAVSSCYNLNNISFSPSCSHRNLSNRLFEFVAYCLFSPLFCYLCLLACYFIFSSPFLVICIIPIHVNKFFQDSFLTL